MLNHSEAEKKSLSVMHLLLGQLDKARDLCLQIDNELVIDNDGQISEVLELVNESCKKVWYALGYVSNQDPKLITYAY